MIKIIKENKNAFILTSLLTSSLGGLILVAEVFQKYNLTGQISLSLSSFAFVLSAVIFVTILLTFHFDKNRRHLIAKKPENLTTATYLDRIRLPKNLLLFICFSVITVSVVSFGTFLNRSATAFEWPGIDMGPFFERTLDPNFAPNDFFTNASLLSSPRHVFGYSVLGIGKIFNLSWYEVFFLLKITLVIALPLLFLFTILKVIRKQIESDARFIAAIIFVTLGIGAIFIDRISGIFSIGWWIPIDTVVRPQTISLLFGLTFSLLSLYKHKHTATGALLLSTLIHPTIGLFSWLFYIVINPSRQTIYQNISTFIIGVIFPLALVTIIFKSDTNFPADEFIYHYLVENHAFHYLPSSLGSLTSLPWFFSFGLIILALSIVFLFSLFTRDRYLRDLSLLSLLTYIGCVVIEYIFIEIYPIKLIASLGPIRFSMFGYWFILLTYSYTLAKYLPYYLIPVVKEVKSQYNRTLLIGLIITLVFIMAIVGLRHKDSPDQVFKNQHTELINWINTNTKLEDVFAVPPTFPPSHVPLFLKRGVFTGNGFPFSEDGFIEHNERKNLIYGSEKIKKNTYNGQPWENTLLYYRDLEIKAILNASQKYRLDYIFIEVGYEKKFIPFTPIFEDKNYKIYAIKDLYAE